MIQVDKDFWRGPYPKDLQELKNKGFVQLISLQTGVYELVFETKRETQNPKKYDLDFWHFPCSDIFPPKISPVLAVLYLLRNGRKTYVHCLSGVDRTGYITAVYQMRYLGYSYKEAVCEWKEKGRHWWFFWWAIFLKKYEMKKE